MAYMPAELDDENDFDDGFMMGDEKVLQSLMTQEAFEAPAPRTITQSKTHTAVASFDQRSPYQPKEPSSTVIRKKRSQYNDRPDNNFNGHEKSEMPAFWKPSLSNRVLSSGHILTEEDFKMAVVKGNVEIAQRCLHQSMAVDGVLHGGWTGLMFACNHGKSQVVEMLLKEGADPSCNVDLYTPLMCACSTSSTNLDVLNCVRLLVEAGVDVNAKDRHHTTGLMLASRLSHLDIVKYLINKGAKVNEQDSRGWTALTWCVQKGHKEVVITLLESGADCNIPHNDRLTVKDIAAHLPTDEMLALLERRPALTSDDDGGMMMSEAARYQDKGLVSTHSILSHGDGYSKSTDLRYGELEIFLLGLDLPHLVPLFQKHLIDLHLLLDLTEQDLINVGVEQLGARKKILEASQAVHKKNWDASSLVSVHFNKRICCADAVAMIANVSKHIRYVNSTVVYVRQQLRYHPHSVINATDRASPGQLVRHVADTSKNVQQLRADLDVLQDNLLKEMKNLNVDPPDLISSQKEKTSNHATYLSVRRCVRICGWVGITTGLILMWRNLSSVDYMLTQTLGKLQKFV